MWGQVRKVSHLHAGVISRACAAISVIHPCRQWNLHWMHECHEAGCRGQGHAGGVQGARALCCTAILPSRFSISSSLCLHLPLPFNLNHPTPPSTQNRLHLVFFLQPKQGCRRAPSAGVGEDSRTTNSKKLGRVGAPARHRCVVARSLGEQQYRRRDEWGNRTK